MKLYIIRHGQTDWNVEGKIQGRQDIPLNDMGRRQARALADGMKSRPVAAVYSSPQKRAMETAEAIAGPLGASSARSAFCVIGNSIGISYYIKKVPE